MIDGHVLQGPAATESAGAALAGLLQPGDLIGLIGDLGAGKTLLVQGIARGLRVPPTVRITSPTFTLVNEYHGGRLALIHADLYRIEKARELDELGLDELVGRADSVVAVEWSDRFDVLGPDAVTVRLVVTGDDRRTLSASGGGTRSRQLAAAWAAALD